LHPAGEKGWFGVIGKQEDLMIQVVQFTHPGLEHGHDTHDPHVKSWNTGPHKRKFLLSEGSYVDHDGTVTLGMLAFWGEWEPPSSVKPLRQPNNDPLYPKWLHRPFLPSRIPTPKTQSVSCGRCKGGTYQNTDPFIFGSCFKYVVCQQYRPSNMNPTKLASLEKGSILLFGSKGHQGSSSFFQVDTVFVVADYLEYDTRDSDALIDGRVSNTYREIVYDMAFPEPTVDSMKLRLYFGATYANPLNGMYSFVPAKPYIKGEDGFPRIKIHDKPYITNNLSQGYKTTGLQSLAESYAVWSELRQITKDSGCVAAFEIQHP
jgi:hypothetical protein